MARQPLTFRQRDVTAAIKAVAAAGCVIARVEIGRDGTIAIVTTPTETGSSPKEINPWGEGRKPSPSPTTTKGVGGSPISDALASYYEQLGFDPRTMDEADMRRLQDAAKVRWSTQIKGSPLNKREREALPQFKGRQAGEMISWRSVKLGIVTAERLEARGWIEIRVCQNNQNRLEGYVLTNEGWLLCKNSLPN